MYRLHPGQQTCSSGTRITPTHTRHISGYPTIGTCTQTGCNTHPSYPLLRQHLNLAQTNLVIHKMNRRAFFKGLSAIAPSLFLPRLIKPVWKPLIEPAYIRMPYPWVELHSELIIAWREIDHQALMAYAIDLFTQHNTPLYVNSKPKRTPIRITRQR